MHNGFIGLLIGINKSINSYISLIDFKPTIGSNEEWRFYFQLTEFLIFSIMSLILFFLIIKRYIKNNMA